MMNLGELTAKERKIVLDLFVGEKVSILFREFHGINGTQSGRLVKRDERYELAQNDGWNLGLFLFREPIGLFTDNSELIESANTALSLVRLFAKEEQWSPKRR